jgi:hypothetical protein
MAFSDIESAQFIAYSEDCMLRTVLSTHSNASLP